MKMYSQIFSISLLCVSLSLCVLVYVVIQFRDIAISRCLMPPESGGQPFRNDS